MTVSMPIQRRLAKCLPPGLVSGATVVYTCNEGSGQALTDRTGNGHHAQLGSAAGTDPYDPAWNLAGLVLGGDDYAIAGNIGGNAGAIQIVISTAAPITPATTGAALANIVTPVSGAGGFCGIGAISAQLTNEIVCIVNNAPGAGTRTGWCDAGGSIAVGWHTISFNWNGSSYDIWVDLTKQTATHGGSGAVALMAASDVVLGAAHTSVYAIPFTGGVAGLAIYPAGLTDAGVVQNHNAFKAILAPRGVALL